MRTGTAPVGAVFDRGDTQNTAPYFGIKGLVLAFLIAVVLCWPMLIAGGPLIFFDTYAYFERGQKLVELVIGPVGAVADPAAGTQEGGNGLQGLRIRSLPYSLYVYLTASSPIGLYLTCILQGTAVLWASLSLLPKLDRSALRAIGSGAIVIGLLSGLPWFVSYAMPDILGAIVAIYYICLLTRIDHLSPKQSAVLALLTTGAILAHYGNLPLAGALALAVLAWRTWRGSLRMATVALALAPVLVAISFNLALGALATNETSAAPNRLPILLARSLEDGPARWYLEDACETRDYAMCELFEDMPQDITAFLWAEEGYRTASDAQVDAIRAEENEILIEAFMRYPVEQTRALLGNAVLQTVKVGTDDMWPVDPPSAALSPKSLAPIDDEAAKPFGMKAFDAIVPITTLFAAAILVLAAASGRIDRSWQWAGALLIAALMVNAVIFGGLSAPVDRYQGRIAWLVPAFLALIIGLRQDRTTPTTLD